MTSRAVGHSTPGYGDRARVVSATSGKEWLGEVLVWGPKGEPFLVDEQTAESRWFPASWVVATVNGPGPADCICTDGAEALQTPERNPNCDRHGEPSDTALILKRARSRP